MTSTQISAFITIMKFHAALTCEQISEQLSVEPKDMKSLVDLNLVVVFNNDHGTWYNVTARGHDLFYAFQQVSKLIS